MKIKDMVMWLNCKEYKPEKSGEKKIRYIESGTMSGAYWFTGDDSWYYLNHTKMHTMGDSFREFEVSDEEGIRIITKPLTDYIKNNLMNIIHPWGDSIV